MKKLNAFIFLAVALIGCNNPLEAISSTETSGGSDSGSTTSITNQCTVEQTSTGATISCGNSSATIQNGVDGIDGTNGSNGTNGSDGTSCTATSGSSGVTINCGSTSATLGTVVEDYVPNVTVDGSGQPPVYSAITASSTRIGNIVFVDISADGDGGAEGSGTSTLRFELPYTSGQGNYSGGGIMRNGSTRTMVLPYVPADSDYVILETTDSSNPYVTGASQSNTSRFIHFSFFYYLD